MCLSSLSGAREDHDQRGEGIGLRTRNIISQNPRIRGPSWDNIYLPLPKCLRTSVIDIRLFHGN